MSSGPHVVYHGTGEVFDRFECPAYFTDDKNTAKFFAERSCPAIIKTCSLTFTKPLVVNLDGQSWGGFFLEDEKLQEACTKYAAGGVPEEEEYFKEEGLTVNFLAGYAETLGYDGVIAYGCMEENGIVGTQYVALKPDVIKILE